MSIQVSMEHGHNRLGENPEEIHAFANQIVGNAIPLTKIHKQCRSGQKVWATYQSVLPVEKAELITTTSAGTWESRVWKSFAAHLYIKGEVTATIPTGARIYFFNLTDSRALVISTEHQNSP